MLNPQAWQYLRQRGFSDTFIKNTLIRKYKIMSKNDYILFPVYNANKLVFLTSRAYKSDKFPSHRHSSQPITTFYNYHAFSNTKKNFVIICESPIDTLSLVYINLPAIGSFGIHGYPKDLSILKHKDPIIMWDNDKTGQLGARKLARDIYLSCNKTCKLAQVPSPYKDINEMLQHLGRDQFKKQILHSIITAKKFIYIEAEQSKPNYKASYNYSNLKDRIDIVNLISNHVIGLKKTGHIYISFCPFHPDKNTKSFVIYPHTQSFFCFGKCQMGGDIIDFIMQLYGYSFKQATNYLQNL